MKRELIAAIAACGVAAPAMAAPGNNYVDGYFLLSEIDTGRNDDDGTGVGVKGAGQVAEQVFLTGEFQTLEYDDSDTDLDQFRFGAGLGPGMGSNGQGVYGRIEYVSFELDPPGPGKLDDDGIVGTVGYMLPVSPQLRLHGEVGYVYLDDIDGPELLGGVSYRVAQNLSLIADYRLSFLETDGGGDADLSDLRLGARFNF
jgi:opacity protein-like surface antigen